LTHGQRAIREFRTLAWPLQYCGVEAKNARGNADLHSKSIIWFPNVAQTQHRQELQIGSLMNIRSISSTLFVAFACLLPTVAEGQIYYVESPVTYTYVQDSIHSPVEVLSVEPAREFVTMGSSAVVQVPPILSSIATVSAPVITQHVETQHVEAQHVEVQQVETAQTVQAEAAPKEEVRVEPVSKVVVEEVKATETVAAVAPVSEQQFEVQAQVYSAPAQVFYQPVQPQAAVCSSGG